MPHAEGPFSTPSRKLRQFAGMWLLVLGALAGLRWRQTGLDLQTALWAGLAASVGLAGLLRPASIRLIYLACVLVTLPIGWCVSQAVLAVIFHGLFTPLGLLFRLRKRDPLRLKPRPNQTTYWAARAQPLDVRDYLRQY